MRNSGNDCKSGWSYPRRQNIHDVCSHVGLSYRSCQRILADELNMRRIAAKFVPCLLNNDQRDHRVQVCTKLQKAVRHDPNFLPSVIIGDESWLYDYDPETKQQSSQWKTPSSLQPKKHTKFIATSSKCWSFFLTFEELCKRSLFHLVRLSMGSFTVRFWEDWGKMWGANGLRCGRTENGCCTMTMHLHTPHSLWGREFLTKNNMTTVPQPAYSPDLAPCDFYVFAKMKLRLKGRRLVSIEEIQAESQQVLNTLMPADFNECFQK